MERRLAPCAHVSTEVTAGQEGAGCGAGAGTNGAAAPCGHVVVPVSQVRARVRAGASVRVYVRVSPSPSLPPPPPTPPPAALFCLLQAACALRCPAACATPLTFHVCPRHRTAWHALQGAATWRWHCLSAAHIPACLAFTDTLMGLASGKWCVWRTCCVRAKGMAHTARLLHATCPRCAGATVKFFPIFFRKEVLLSPAAVSLM